MALAFLPLDARAAAAGGSTPAPSISGTVIAVSLAATIAGLA